MESKDKFFSRELSALAFNARVLAEGMDASLPLLERLKFLGIVSSNLDEFFMVRMASFFPDDLMRRAACEAARRILERQEQYFIQTLVPEMEKAGIIRLSPEACDQAQMSYLQNFFLREILPVLTPIRLSDTHALPTLSNLRLHMIVRLASAGAKKEAEKMAVVEIPANLHRMIFLPSEKGLPFVLLEDVIGAFVADLFHGHQIEEKGFFRLTRGAEMSLDEEKDEDFAKVMAEALRRRRAGDVTRLEVQASSPLTRFLQEKLLVRKEDVFPVEGWFDLKTIAQLASQPGLDEWKRPTWVPCDAPDFEKADTLWELLQKKSVMVLHPYQSFDVVNRFAALAAEDPDVLAIKCTLYRTDQDSSVVKSLERAAEKGKRVTVLIELKARFDEEKNIEWAKRLELAGATVLYGVVGYKVHAKAFLVVRREREGIRRYVHLSTGNYNERTSRLYSDVGYFSSEEGLTDDISAFFNMVTGYSQPVNWARIDVAPYGLRRRILRMIRREAQRSTPERRGQIMAKMNSLVDPEIIEALYKASQAGVQIKLNVRGICGLRPGVKGLSETIEVVSIVDQFLEHSRIFYFANAGDEEVFLSSADWMPRNLDRRIEMIFPIDDKENKKALIDVLRLYFRDNTNAWRLGPDGTYERLSPEGKRRVRAQETLCQQAEEAENQARKSPPQELRPQRPIHA